MNEYNLFYRIERIFQLTSRLERVKQHKQLKYYHKIHLTCQKHLTLSN